MSPFTLVQFPAVISPLQEQSPKWIDHIASVFYYLLQWVSYHTARVKCLICLALSCIKFIVSGKKHHETFFRSVPHLM